MNGDVDSGFSKPRAHAPRKSARETISAEVQLRRSGQHNYVVRAFDLSCEGCKLEFVERPSLEETLWVKFDGLAALEASVCWIANFSAGVKFAHPIHSAIFDSLVTRLR